MSEGLKKLQEIGAQKIYEDTHIALSYVQSILHESFEGLNKVQFIGFISILEREYSLTLEELKESGLTYFESETTSENSNSGVFVAPKKKRKWTLFYAFIAVVIFLVALVNNMNQEAPAPVVIDNTKIESVSNIIPETVDVNTTKEPVVVEEKPEVVPVKKSLFIKPHVKVWVGYIDVKTRKKHQTVTSKSIELDPKKEWLLSLGHGNLSIEINGEEKSFKTPNSVRFLYKDGKLKKLTIAEFKKLNKDRLW